MYYDKKQYYKNLSCTYGSLKCGISGSTNFFIMLYLISNNIYLENEIYKKEKKLNKDDIKNIEKNNINLIFLCILTLAGDGGHNCREVIFGITIFVIIINTMINDVKKEIFDYNWKKFLNNYGNNYNSG